jgi:hypothetical protein
VPQWQPEYRQPHRALPPPAVPPQFERRPHPVRDRLATGPHQLRSLGHQATQQVRQLRPPGQLEPSQPGWRPAPYPQAPIVRRDQQRRFLRVLLVVQVTFIAWVVTGLALNHDDRVARGLGLLTVAGIWMGLDCALGLGYGVYRLTARR